MNSVLRNALVLAGMAIATQATAQVTFYEHDGFQGRSFTAEKKIGNFERYGFNDRASSVVVLGGRWEVCDDAQFGGRCVVLRLGRYPSLAAMSLNDRVSSVRAVGGKARIDDSRYAPAPAALYDDHRRGNERVYQANVTSVRAVVGPPEQRCWIEREQVVQERGGANVGRDGGGQHVTTRSVQRCGDVPSHGRPDYWDVTYDFRGQEHRMQMTSPPGPTVTVNGQGEPRA